MEIHNKKKSKQTKEQEKEKTKGHNQANVKEEITFKEMTKANTQNKQQIPDTIDPIPQKIETKRKKQWINTKNNTDRTKIKID
ncbi:hypothetical protein [Bacteroides graminisolvens]|uniref:hypothetical protein n=1 Tax=Bacteroides graminisolvens TaxID=477666 RepID=UPI00042A6C20|nr:hypothetical protein [Bacteroides graminisolvens]